MSEMNSMFDVSGKVAVVTGGTVGIGAMIAEGLVANGARTYIAARKADDLREAANRLGELGEIHTVEADLSTTAGRAHLVRTVAEAEPAVDVLVNNAGTGHMADFEEYDEKGWDRTFDLNIKGVFFLTQQMLPLLRARATEDVPSRVINIGSIDGLRPPPVYEHIFAYPASKAALHHLTRDLAQKLAPLVTVNAVAPGAFDSRLNGPTIAQFRKQIERATPCRRIGRPVDMAGVVIYLSSAAGAFLTGTVIPVDGGISTT
jgi:NAD(P)-dependent dehydrogenase (short-subunit alcohol dehydrogenase family)